jgi:hypothetical protein
MGAQTIPEDAPRQGRYCPTCGHTAVHWGLLKTIEAMVEAHDMRPRGGVGEWTCAECGRREDVIQLHRSGPIDPWAADLERWEDEGGAPPGRDQELTRFLSRESAAATGTRDVLPQPPNGEVAAPAPTLIP